MNTKIKVAIAKLGQSVISLVLNNKDIKKVFSFVEFLSFRFASINDPLNFVSLRPAKCFPKRFVLP